MIRINQLKLPIHHTEEQLHKKIEKEIKTKDFTYAIARRSVDARRGELHYIYSVNVQVKNETKIIKKINNKNIMLTEEIVYAFEPRGKEHLSHRPVVIGSGPGGLFCAYMLAKNGYAPIILERGEDVETRTKTVETFFKEGLLHPESNVQFGEGGAGTFSDGKINTLVKDHAGRNDFVLQTFVKFGADESILYDSKPHIGTDVLIGIMKKMREYIVCRGGEYRFLNKVTDFEWEEGRLTKLIVSDACRNETYALQTDVAVLAIGHSARDTFYKLYEKHIDMEAKPFAVGVRVEHRQERIDQSQYGGTNTQLGAASYKVTAQAKSGRGVYSFCMCPGGYVVNASSEEGYLAVNGMSYSSRDGENANSAIVVQVRPTDFKGEGPLSGIAFQRELERSAYEAGKGKIPVQRYQDFKDNVVTTEYGLVKSQTKGDVVFANVREILPDFIGDAIVDGMEMFGKKIKGFDDGDTLLSGVETRTSSPVRIVRDEGYEANIRGIYPCGEGAGYAGGIMSAAMDGMKIYEAIAAKYAPF